jgi:glycosyltransferase involved in cell wall biosynthesis
MRRAKKIAVIGNYLPRQCGIATFTTDLCNALAGQTKKIEENLIAVAMDDVPEGYDYPDRVKFQIRAHLQPDYIRAADFLNVHKFDLAILQHEYGIFGGNAGSHVLHLVQNLRMPVIITLHTVLRKPTEEQRFIIQELAKYSEFFIVMAHHADTLLKEVYGIDDEKVVFIPHGIPDVPFKRADSFRKSLGLENKKTLFTFGLLSPGKGLEVMIDAMPRIIEKHPDVVYTILGKTHPHIKDEFGDSYRQGLFQQISKLGIDKYVLFKDQFVEIETLTEYIKASDIYVTPYVSEDQIVSGTLAYALGMGTVVVSTPYLYAKEMTADGRGSLVPFSDPEAMAKKIISLLDNEDECLDIRKKCYQHGRSMIWKKVGSDYLDLGSRALRRAVDRPMPEYLERTDARIVAELPEVNLHHMKVMTDDTGIRQHAKYSIPDLTHGYCVDDNARALIVASMHYSLQRDKNIIPLIQRYLSFLHFSFNPENGRFRNFMSYDRRWLEEVGSEDSHGRSLWGLGVAIKYAPNDAIRNMAATLFLDGIRVVDDFTSPRAWAFTIIGLHAYMSFFGGDASARRRRTKLAKRLFELFKDNATKEWMWCEERATYANAKLPHALILAGQWIPHTKMHEMGIASLKWLLKEQTAPEGHLSTIGNLNWHERKGERSTFDQQPIEAMCLVEACAEAYRSTRDTYWLEEGQRCLGWFMGRNDINENVYVFNTGGCCDGIHEHGVNDNQGAESTLAWLISLLTMYEVLG